MIFVREKLMEFFKKRNNFVEKKKAKDLNHFKLTHIHMPMNIFLIMNTQFS